jgi:molybdopterin converting factor subunit 1
MRLLYFAWLKSVTGRPEEVVDPPEEVRDVRGLIDWLKTRDDELARVLGDEGAIRIAVNQEYARPADPVGPEDEVALFPPVTGG